MSKYRVEIVLFVSLWLLYGALTNSRNLYHMGQNHGAVQALVERGHFYMEELDPAHPPRGDNFAFGGYVYSNKQPGAVFVGSAVFAVLYRLGWTYRDSWDITAATVSWLTTGLATALLSLLVYRRAFAWCGNRRWAFGCALACGAASSLFPYTGTLYHDSLVTLWVFAAFCAFDRAPWLSGLLLGFTPTTSLLPSTMVIGACAWFVAQRRWRELPGFAVGFAAGLLPLLVYNTVLFGHPLHNAAVIAGVWPEAQPRFDPAMILHLARIYLRLFVWYEPIVLLGLIGLARLAATGERQRVLAALLVVLQFCFTLSIGTEGPCSYGPRYLLTVVPFASLGLLAFRDFRWRTLTTPILVLAGAFGFVVNFVGAMYGTMYCDTNHWAFLHYADAIRHRAFYSYPLLGIEGRDPRQTDR